MVEDELIKEILSTVSVETYFLPKCFEEKKFYASFREELNNAYINTNQRNHFRSAPFVIKATVSICSERENEMEVKHANSKNVCVALTAPTKTFEI